MEGLTVITSPQCRGALIRFMVPSVNKYFSTIIETTAANIDNVEQLVEGLIECIVGVAEPFKAELLKRWGYT